VAVLLVLVGHFFPKKFPGAFIGVDIFFVISGFLISSIIFKEIETGAFTFKHFYSRRVNRIFPSLIVIFLFCLVFGFLGLHADEFKNIGEQIAAGSVFSANILFYKEIGYWDRNSLLKALLHLWSLGIEEQFYLFWPVFLIILFNLKASFRKLLILLVIVASLSCSVILTEKNQPAAFYLIFSRLWELAAGGMLSSFLTQKKKRDAQSLSVNEKLFFNILSIVGFASIISFALYPVPVNQFPGKFAIIPVFGSLLIIFSRQNSFLNSAVLSSRPAVYVGLISYPLYLWHWPLLSFLFLYKNGQILAGNKIYLIIITFILASATYHLVENPIKKANVSVVRKAVFITMAMVLICFSGFLVFRFDGLPYRYESNISLVPKQAKSVLLPIGLIGDSNAGHLVEGLRFRLSSHLVTEIASSAEFVGSSLKIAPEPEPRRR
jgi:peptidoglycan/LPS O-acetylase OafA/YrhL